jgi:hypothetical protein
VPLVEVLPPCPARAAAPRDRLAHRHRYPVSQRIQAGGGSRDGFENLARTTSESPICDSRRRLSDIPLVCQGDSADLT